MIIRVSYTDWLTLADAVLYGQDTGVICEVAEAPQCDYTEVSDDYRDFEQRCLEGKLFQYISDGAVKTRKPTVGDITEIRAKIALVGERAKQANTLAELDLMHELAENPAGVPEETIAERVSDNEQLIAQLWSDFYGS